MRIKRIEIIGFKSFVDRTVVNIDEPITAIVGPNGCGKSNIVDAIRWCMGEQSAKHLRGKSMDDVIFAGSESRGPAGMAEVSLTFENVGFARRDDRSVVEQEAEEAMVALEGAAAEAVEATFDPEAVLAQPLPADPEAEAQAAADELDKLVDGDIDPLAAIDAAVAAAAAEAPPREEVVVAEAQAILNDEPQGIDFSQYGEVTISRRLFRDGTSEYMINKTPSRLRDVQDFFLGTGVGTKAYSIIEQGRVGMIVSSKPEERRLIIEEAAGITKFKKKKQAAERKMDQTRQNLLRVSDVVDEIDKRLGSLRRQAQKAERYKKYRAEVRDIELWSASHRYLGLIAEEGVALSMLAERMEQHERLAVEHDKRESAIVAERAEAQLEERVLSELTQTVFDLDNRVKLGESQVEFQSREARQLEERATGAAGEIDGLKEQRENALLELEQLRVEESRLTSDAGAREEELLRSDEEQRMLRAEVQDAQAELDQERGEISKAQADIARTEGQMRSLERRRSDLDMRLARVSEEQARIVERHGPLVEQVAELETRLDGLRQLRLDLADQKEDLERRLKELKELVGKNEAEVETLRTELHRRRSRLTSLIEIQDKYEGFARGTRAIMQHRPGDDAEHKRILGLIADVVSAPAEYEAAVEALLGERLGSVLVDSKDAGALGVDFLKKRSEGRSTFIPVASFAGGSSSGGIEVIETEGVRGPLLSLVKTSDEYAGVAQHLIGDALVVESLQRALELLDAGLRRTMVTLDGDVIDPRGVVTGGSRESSGAGVLQQKREIRELEEICEGLDRDLADAQARHVANKQELTRVTGALDALKKHAHEGEIQYLSTEKDFQRYRAEAEQLAKRKAQIEKELDEAGGQLGECERESEESRMTLESSRVRADEAERRQLGLIEGVTMARGRYEDAAQRSTEAKVMAAQAQAAQRSAAAQRGRLELQEAELARRVDKLATLIEESSGRASELREESTRISIELTSLRSERLCAAEELTMKKVAHEQRSADLQVAEVELREIRQAADKAKSDLGKLEIKRHDLASKKQVLVETIAEKHRVELAKELFDHHLRPPVTETEESRLRELRDLIDRMGEINLTAIEEYEELAKRYDFLTGQKKDLESALEQLERAIAKINKTSRKLFKETFDAVNAKFMELYPRLFRGGNAYLKLTGGADVEEGLLDAGVEIFAQPPGKKNTTVELLSGGEKALTAVALIFSIFLIKPSPFCLLDEVDAPLDEANVGRYNDIVRSMTESSQFIVITHNKRTMEIADSLYGVTMQEPGCSKLVSVNLKGFQPRKAAA